MQGIQRTDERGVAPVIAVILMVAITTILAAIIGFFVIDTGESQQTTPQANFEFEYNGSDVVVSHQGGQTFDTKNSARLEVRVDGTVNGTFDLTGGVSSGESVVVNASTGETVTVVWIGPEAEQTDILDEFVVP